MAKQHKVIDGALLELFKEGKWTEFIKSLRYGIYDLEMPDYSTLRSLQVIISRVNMDDEHPYKFSVSVNYKNLPILVRLTVDKRKCKNLPNL